MSAAREKKVNTFDRAPEIRKDDRGTLLCPRCGGSYMEQADVYVWERHGEDSETLSYAEMVGCVGIAHNNVKASDFPGNPSFRRQGLCITFECEACHHNSGHPSQKLLPFCLNIVQHKGETFIEWELPTTVLDKQGGAA